DLSGASSGQVKFPATQNASSNVNTLDDYEEGTWTPVLSFGGGTTGITYGTQLGTYTKIGRLVEATLRITLTSKGTSTGGAAIGGLPFTIAGNASHFAATVGLTLNMNAVTGAIHSIGS